MDRRSFLKHSGAGATGAAITGLVPKDRGRRPLDPERLRALPNILWLCTDQQRYDTVGALNNPHIRTPNLDRLVEHGASFTHAYCQSPICTPSRASFLTGCYPSTVHGCINGNAAWEAAAPLVTKLLAEHGYIGGLAGKLHLSAADGRVEPRPDDGYAEFYWSHHPWDSWPVGHAYNEWLEAQGHDYSRIYDQLGYIPPEIHQTTWCADHAIGFMERHAERPWFFSFNCFDPHNPYDPPHEYLDRFDVDRLPGPLFRKGDIERQRALSAVEFQTEPAHPEKDFDGKLLQAQYWAMVELVDENVGRMLDALEATGQLDNTVVVFTSDHGDMIGDHGLQKKGCRFYDGLVRVPLIVSWPGRVRAGLRSDALVELTDLAPTLLDLAGLEVPAHMQGRSLVPLLEGATTEHRPHVRSEYYDVLAGPLVTYGTMIRDGRFKLSTYHGHPLGELFDMETDPGEFDNLWDDPNYADVRFRLLKASFDDTAFAVDLGPERIGRY